LQAISNASALSRSLIISKDKAEKGIMLAEYILAHKLSLITDCETKVETVKALTKQDLLLNKGKVAKVLTQARITARNIHTYGRTLGAKTTKDARSLIEILSQTGFGEIESGKQNSFRLKRKLYNEMPPAAQELLHELNVSVDAYNSAAKLDEPQTKSKKVKKSSTEAE
jgi:hypothetical protein